MGNHLVIKRYKLLIYPTIWVDLKGIMLGEKKAILKSSILYDSIYISLKWQN